MDEMFFEHNGEITWFTIRKADVEGTVYGLFGVETQSKNIILDCEGIS